MQKKQYRKHHLVKMNYYQNSYLVYNTENNAGYVLLK